MVWWGYFGATLRGLARIVVLGGMFDFDDSEPASDKADSERPVVVPYGVVRRPDLNLHPPGPVSRHSPSYSSHDSINLRSNQIGVFAT